MWLRIGMLSFGRTGRPDRRDARVLVEETLDLRTALPARAQLLHAAAGARGAAARRVHRLAAARHGGRARAGILFVLPGMLAMLALSISMRAGAASRS